MPACMYNYCSCINFIQFIQKGFLIKKIVTVDHKAFEIPLNKRQITNQIKQNNILHCVVTQCG